MLGPMDSDRRRAFPFELISADCRSPSRCVSGVKNILVERRMHDILNQLVEGCKFSNVNFICCSMDHERARRD